MNDEERTKGKECRQGVEHQGGRTRREPLKQSVVDVIMIADKQRPTAQKAAHHSEQCIEHGEAEGYKRYYDGEQR